MSDYVGFKTHPILADQAEVERLRFGMSKTDYFNYILARHFAKQGDNAAQCLATVYETAVLARASLEDA